MKHIALILILMMPSWAWAENYLCIGEEASGFAVQDDKYKATIFDTRLKYLVSADKGTVTIHGWEVPFFNNCQNHDDRIYCPEFGAFFMHKNNLRFMRFHSTFGYAYATNEDQPFIEIGTCTKF